MAVIVNFLVSANSQEVLGLCRPMDLVGFGSVARWGRSRAPAFFQTEVGGAYA
jgi:hypothetical protein